MTDTNKSWGWVWEGDFKIFAFWFWKWQIEIYLLPKDWAVFYWRDFGLVSLGPVAINWSDTNWPDDMEVEGGKEEKTTEKAS